MDQQQTQTPAPPTTTTIASQPAEPPPQLPTQPQEQPPTSSLTTPTTTPSHPNPNPNPNPSHNPSYTPAPNPPQPSKPTSSQPQPRPTSFSRPWQQQQQQQQQHSHFSHFPTHSSSSSSSPSSSASPRGAIAIGVPAPRPSSSSPQPSTSFSASFAQPFGALGRTGVNVPDSVSNSSPMQARQQVQGIQGMGMMGSLGSSSQLRPGGISVQHHQQRPIQQSSFRPPTSSPNSQSPATQNFQGQGLMRVSPAGSPSSPAPNASQSMQSLNQPWLSSGSQGKPPLPPPSSYRPQMNSPSMQQRSHIPQQQHVSSVQPQPKPSHQLQEPYGQQIPSSRVPQSLPHQQQIMRAQGSAVQKPSSLAMVQPNTVQPGTLNRTANAESDESGNQILSKRSIHELVNQIDPSERLDPEVEDILVDIAEDFVESITTFGCLLAKHRKSDMLEAKDILLHVERNWNMMLPGFSGDEIKTYRKPLPNDIHKERLAVIKKSIMATEVANSKSSVGQAAVNAKSNVGKTPANFVGAT